MFTSKNHILDFYLQTDDDPVTKSSSVILSFVTKMPYTSYIFYGVFTKLNVLHGIKTGKVCGLQKENKKETRGCEKLVLEMISENIKKRQNLKS